MIVVLQGLDRSGEFAGINLNLTQAGHRSNQQLLRQEDSHQQSSIKAQTPTFVLLIDASRVLTRETCQLRRGEKRERGGGTRKMLIRNAVSKIQAETVLAVGLDRFFEAA